MLPKPSLCCNGAVFLITSGASPFSCWASWALSSPQFSSGFPALSGRSSLGIDLREMVDHHQLIIFQNDSRCLNGMLNGNLGVIKSMIAELTDETNVARGFSLMPMARALGYVIGFVGHVPRCHRLVTDVLETWAL
jgi:hypothetical protein